MAEIEGSAATRRGTWVQTERAHHEAWAGFLALKGGHAASRVMHLLLARLGDNNAVVISQGTMATLLNYDSRTVRRAIAMLREHNWIDVMQIGEWGTVNAYVINSHVAWTGSRDNIRYAKFNATVVVSSEEQPDAQSLDTRPPLHQFPTLFPGERQLPSGDGLPPPSEPFLPDMEPDLPAIEQVDPAAASETVTRLGRAWRVNPETDELDDYDLR